jgi:hypothetical protein
MIFILIELLFFLYDVVTFPATFSSELSWSTKISEIARILGILQNECTIMGKNIQEEAIPDEKC